MSVRKRFGVIRPYDPRFISRFVDGKYLLLYEFYKQGAGSINRFCTRIIEEFYGYRLRMFRAVRHGAAVVINLETGVVELSCTVYIRNVLSAMCVGNLELVDLLAKHLGVRAIIVSRELAGKWKKLREFATDKRTYFLLISIDSILSQENS